MASTNKVIGGKKLDLALRSIERKITRGGVLRMGFLEGSRYPERTNARFLKAVGSKATPTAVPGIPIAQAAFWNEFGTTRAPARPAFRTTIARKSKEWGDNLSKAVVAANYDGRKALMMVGQGMRDDLENAIAQWSSPANAPFTVKVKGFDKPLVDSGDMQRAPDFEVVDK